MMSNNPETTYEDLEATDVISVELVPERKGLILKHCEYYVSSRRYGTTVTRRYNEFAQLYDILYAKYPYRAVCRLPPKRVVVGGGSAGFLRGRRAALQRWLTLAARHPVLAHDADLRAFLCEPHPALEKPKHDEFQLAGTQSQDTVGDLSIEEMQAQFIREQEQLRVLQLGLSRLSQIFAKVENRCMEERASFQELGAGLQALGLRGGEGAHRGGIQERLADAAQVAIQMGEDTETLPEDGVEEGDGGQWAVSAALDALGAYRELGARLSRGLHAERAAAASASHAHAQHLRNRHRYALLCALQEGGVARAYAFWALERIPGQLAARVAAHNRLAHLWGQLHATLKATR